MVKLSQSSGPKFAIFDALLC